MLFVFVGGAKYGKHRRKNHAGTQDKGHDAGHTGAAGQRVAADGVALGERARHAGRGDGGAVVEGAGCELSGG